MGAVWGLVVFVAFAAGGLATMWKLGPTFERWSIDKFGEDQDD